VIDTSSNARCLHKLTEQVADLQTPDLYRHVSPQITRITSDRTHLLRRALGDFRARGHWTHAGTSHKADGLIHDMFYQNDRAPSSRSDLIRVIPICKLRWGFKPGQPFIQHAKFGSLASTRAVSTRLVFDIGQLPQRAGGPCLQALRGSAGFRMAARPSCPPTRRWRTRPTATTIFQQGHGMAAGAQVGGARNTRRLICSAGRR